MTTSEDTPRTCPRCGRAMARINGRTLRLSKTRGEALRRGDETRWIHICPICERLDLFDDRQVTLPFQDHAGVMRTAQDEATGTKDALSMAGFSFTRYALESAVTLANRKDDDAASIWSTARVEAQAQQYRRAPSHQSALALSNAICHWGRGGRVRGNLHKRHGNTLGSKMDRWMQAALAADTDEVAITFVSSTRKAGLPEGLGVSFGSKHLRMLDPDRFAVLDSALSEGLGYALNPKGYALFMRHLREFHKQLTASGWDHSLARTESGLFVLVRQNVRVESDQPVTPSEA